MKIALSFVARRLVSLLALAAATTASAGTITGTVRDASGNALAGIKVAAYPRDGGKTVFTSGPSNDKGKYSITGIDAGIYGVAAYDPARFYATSFQNNAESFDRSDVLSVGASTTHTIDFQLVVGGTVAGRVTAGGSATSGITVAAYNLSGTLRASTDTDPSGNYSLLLPPGQYKLVAYDLSARAVTTFYRNELTWADAAVISIQPRVLTSADFALELAAHINGSVVDKTSNSALAGLYVYAYSASGAVLSTQTDAFGRFRINAPSGSYRVVVADASKNYATVFVPDATSFGASTPFNIAPGSTVDLTVVVPRAGRVVGRVTDDATGNAVAATVTAYAEDGTPRGSTHTDTTGGYVLPLAAGSYRIVAYDDNLTFATQFYNRSNVFSAAATVTVTEWQNVPGVDFALVRAGRFSGSITDAETHAPLNGITVAAYDSAGNLLSSANSNAAGLYTLVVPAGTYRLLAYDVAHVYANSFAGSATSFEGIALRSISPQATEVLDFGMRRGWKVSGTVTDGSHQPLSGIEVSALDVQGNHIGSATTTAGAFQLAVHAGSYKFVARDVSGRYSTVYFGGTTTLSTATVVTVNDGNSPPLTFMVFQQLSRRRSVSH